MKIILDWIESFSDSYRLILHQSYCQPHLGTIRPRNTNFSGSASWGSYDVASVELGGGEPVETEETNNEEEGEEEVNRDPTFRLRWTQDHLCQ